MPGNTIYIWFVLYKSKGPEPMEPIHGQNNNHLEFRKQIKFLS